MKTNPYPGLFVDIEGPDGAGSKTRMTEVSRRLWEMGIKTYTTEEPTIGPIGRILREEVTEAKDKKISFDPLTRQLLFIADRSDHLARELQGYLEKDWVVLTKRFLWSTIAYASREWRQTLLEIQTKLFPLPDLSIFLKIPPEFSMRRVRQRAERERELLEIFENEETQKEVLVAYLELATQFPGEIRVVEVSDDKEADTAEILSLILDHEKGQKLLKLANK